MLPLLYTELFKASQFGSPVVRALALEYPNDKETYQIETQFLWGRSILIIPILEQGQTQINAYLPAGIYYDYIKQTIVSKSPNEGKYLEMDIPIDRIGILLRAGHIVLTQKPKLTIKETRKSQFDVIVALDENSQADGSLYFDDGEDYRIEATKNYNYAHFYAYKVICAN